MEVELLLPLWLNCHLEILAWQHWQHASAGPLVCEGHPAAQPCPVHSCRSLAACRVQGRLLPNPIVSKHDYLSYLQSPASSSFCLAASLAVPALNMAPALSTLRPPSSSP